MYCGTAALPFVLNCKKLKNFSRNIKITVLVKHKKIETVFFQADLNSSLPGLQERVRGGSRKEKLKTMVYHNSTFPASLVSLYEKAFGVGAVQ